MIHGIDYEHIYTQQLNTTIEELDLSVRTYNCIKRDGINTVAELLNNLHRLDKIRNLDGKCRDEIYKKLQEMSDVINNPTMSQDEKNKKLDELEKLYVSVEIIEYKQNTKINIRRINNE